MSNCVKCNNSTFRVQTQEPGGSNFKMVFVQCASCGVPVGVMEALNAGAEIGRVHREVDSLAQQVRSLSQTVDQMRHWLYDMYQRR